MFQLHSLFEAAAELCSCDYVQKRKIAQLTYRQPAQNGDLMDLVCQAILCLRLSIQPMQISTNII